MDQERETFESVSEAKSWFFEETSKIDMLFLEKI